MTGLPALFTQAARLPREAADEAMSQHGVRAGQRIVLSALWDQDGPRPVLPRPSRGFPAGQPA